MAGRRRRLTPQPRRKKSLKLSPQDRLAKTIADLLTGRAGAAANAPFMDTLITMMASQSASDWHNKHMIAVTIYRDALAKLGIGRINRAKVYMLANAATKVVLRAKEGLLNMPVEQELEYALKRANQNIGAPEEYLNAVKKAALAYLGRVPSAPS